MKRSKAVKVMCAAMAAVMLASTAAPMPVLARTSATVTRRSSSGRTSGTIVSGGSSSRSLSGRTIGFLYRMAGSPRVSYSVRNGKVSGLPFTDIPGNAYYTKAIVWAYRNGIANGTSSTAFSPNANVTKVQSVLFLYRYANM